MIIELPHTTTGAVGDRLVRLRDEGGVVSLGRVLTLVVETGAEDVETAIAAANAASREHPCRIVLVDRSRPDDDANLDAEIRIGGDAGASEVVVLRPGGAVAQETDTLVIPLLLPDAPVVVWWPSTSPERPAEDPLGAAANRRITDAMRCSDPLGTLRRLRDAYTPGDTDLSWSRATMWRAILATALDQPPHDVVTAVTVHGNARRPASVLLAAWLADGLDCAATLVDAPSPRSVTEVHLDRASGPIRLVRPVGSSIATLEQPGLPCQRIVLPPRSRAELLAEELRRLDPDETYGRVLTRGLGRVDIREAMASDGQRHRGPTGKTSRSETS